MDQLSRLRNVSQSSTAWIILYLKKSWQHLSLKKTPYSVPRRQGTKQGLRFERRLLRSEFRRHEWWLNFHIFLDWRQRAQFRAFIWVRTYHPRNFGSRNPKLSPSRLNKERADVVVYSFFREWILCHVGGRKMRGYAVKQCQLAL